MPTSEKIQLQAEPRTIIGRKVKTVRKNGLLPAVIYGHGFEALNIQIPLKDFEKIYTKAGESTLVYLNVGGETYPTIIHEVSRDPRSDKLQHADFYKVRLDEKIKADIQLNFIGESPAVKGMAGILVKNISQLEVEGFPQDLPNKVDVDISKLVDFKSQILVKDLQFSPKVAVKAKPEEIVCLIQEPISEEELKAQLETPAAGAPEEVEVIKKEKLETEPAEGETPAPAAPAQPEKK
jgi:large subunit ribosomal protein L25